jgi:hypothetical protein
MIEENVIKDRQQSLLASAPIYYSSGGCFDTHAKGEIFTLIYCRTSSITDYLMAIAGKSNYLLLYKEKNKIFLLFIAGVFSR